MGCIPDASRSQSATMGKRDLYVYASKRALWLDDGNVGYKAVIGIPAWRYLRHAAAKLLDLWDCCQAGQYDAENERNTTEESCGTASSGAFISVCASTACVVVETTRILGFDGWPLRTSAGSERGASITVGLPNRAGTSSLWTYSDYLFLPYEWSFATFDAYFPGIWTHGSST
jgi:hypothetical protein